MTMIILNTINKSIKKSGSTTLFKINFRIKANRSPEIIPDIKGEMNHDTTNTKKRVAERFDNGNV